MTTLPLPALVGLDSAVQALLLLAVEPRLGGIAVAANAGSGKSSLARGFAELLPDAAFIELPLGADDEGLLGGLDLEATLRSGRRVARPGLLQRADGGAVYVDQVNLLADGTANILLGALDAGALQIERDGVSARVAARFVLLASYDPAEGQPRRHLVERLGLLLVLPRAAEQRERATVVRRNLEPLPHELLEWDEELEALRLLVTAARDALPSVTIADEQIAQLAALAVACGVEGQRVDLFATYAARACAALALRDAVEQTDLELAARLTILPRATRQPAPPEPPPPPDAPQPPPPDPPPADDRPDDQRDDELDAPDEPAAAAPPSDDILAALSTELPPELEQLPFRALRRGRAGSRGSVAGKRGRHIRSAPGDIRRNRLDVPATLRAAAPWQLLRHSEAASKGDKGTGAQREKRGEVRRLSSPDLPGARSAAMRPRLRLRGEDLRVKEYRSKAGALFCFAVDASGSMALHRMRQAKGAVHALLQRAYVHRDRVALLAFRGERAEVLLPPSQSVELARRALDTLPTGGGTPLASALLAAIETARQARGKGIMQMVLVLLTDGRANVGLRGGGAGVTDELKLLGTAVAAEGIRSVVVDTQKSYLSRGEARTLAGYLGGEYVYLPNARGEQIADIAASQV